MFFILFLWRTFAKMHSQEAGKNEGGGSKFIFISPPRVTLFLRSQIQQNCSHKGDDEFWWLELTVLSSSKNWKIPLVYKNHGGHWLSKKLVLPKHRRKLGTPSQGLLILSELSTCCFYSNQPKERMLNFHHAKAFPFQLATQSWMRLSPSASLCRFGTST